MHVHGFDMCTVAGIQLIFFSGNGNSKHIVNLQELLQFIIIITVQQEKITESTIELAI